MARYQWLIVVLVIVLVMLPACAKKQVAPVEQPVEQVPPTAPPPAVEQPPVVEQPAVADEFVLGDVYYDFDKYSIRDEYKDVLVKNAEQLMASPNRKLLVEGHCDARGTNEYNMALGEKRAKSVVDFYVTYGIDKARITWISYGEEKPFDTGSSETAWAKNRRAHMVLQ